MTARGDASLAAVALLAFGVALARRGVAPAPIPAVVGGIGTLAFEAAAGRYHERVREIWERPITRALAVAAAFAVAAAAGRLGVRPIASFAVGALATYLCVLALVLAGVLAPPRKWFGGRDGS